MQTRNILIERAWCWQVLKPVPRLLKIPESTPEGSERQKHAASGQAVQTEMTKHGVAGDEHKTRSRFTRKQCIEYAKVLKQQGQAIKNPYALGTTLWKSTEQDEYIMIWLGEKASAETAA